MREGGRDASALEMWVHAVVAGQRGSQTGCLAHGHSRSNTLSLGCKRQTFALPTAAGQLRKSQIYGSEEEQWSSQPSLRQGKLVYSRGLVRWEQTAAGEKW